MGIRAYGIKIEHVLKIILFPSVHISPYLIILTLMHVYIDNRSSPKLAVGICFSPICLLVKTRLPKTDCDHIQCLG